MRYWTTLSISILLTIACFMIVLPGISSASANVIPVFLSPSTQWIGSGPSSDTLRLQYYSGFTGDVNEYNALCFAQPSTCTPQIDLTDVQIPTAEVTSANNNDPRFYVTPETPAFDVEHVDFNLANSFFSVEFCNGADGITPASTCPDGPGATPIPAACPNTVFRTSTGALDCTKAGIAIRQGIAHLIDKQGYVNNVLQGLGVALDNFLSAAQGTLHSGQDFSCSPACPPAANSPNPTNTNPPRIGPYAVDPTLPIGSQQVFPPYLGGTYSHPACTTTSQILGDSGPCYLTVGGACSWDVLVSCGSTFQGQSQVSAFHLSGDGAADANGMVPVGSPDFCAAAQDWVDAGLATGVTTDGNCTLIGFVGVNPGALAGTPGGPILVVHRTSLDRGPLATGIAISVCRLIHGPSTNNCAEIQNPTLGIAQTQNLIAHIGCKSASEPGTTCTTQGPKRTWNIYTGGNMLGFQVNNLYGSFNSQYASDLCGGTSPSEVAFDYVMVCNVMNDVWSAYGEFAGTPSIAVADTQIANDIFGNHTFVIPIMEHSSQDAYLNGWSGISNALGIGIAQGNQYSLLNAYNPNPAILGPTIRWGQKDSPVSLNPFSFNSVVEADVIQSVYDSLLALNPYAPDSLYGYMVNSFQIVHNAQDGNCPLNVQTSTGTWPVGGCVKMALRGDISWQDVYQCAPTDSACLQSHVVTAQDVKFSIANYNATGGLIAPSTQNTVDVLYNPSSLPSAAFGAYGGTQANGEPEILYVALKTLNAWSLLDIAAIPILPQHVWETASATGPCLSPSLGNSTVDDAYANTPACQVEPLRVSSGTNSTDPIVNNLLVGSGAWVCASGVLGAVGTVYGGHCSSSGNQNPQAGDQVTLRRFTYQGTGSSQQGTLNLNYAYFRTNGKFKNFAWADYLAARGTTGTTNGFGAQGTVDIRDIQSVASCLRVAPPYTTPPCDHWASPAATVTATGAGPNIGLVGGGNGAQFQESIRAVAQVSRWYSTQFYDWLAPTGPTPLLYGVNGNQLGPGSSPSPGSGQQILYEDGTNETS